MESSLTRTAAAFTVALSIHIFILLLHPEWRLPGMSRSEPASVGITVRIASTPPGSQQKETRIDPKPANVADSLTQAGPRPETASISAGSGQQATEARSAIIKPESAIKKAPEVVAPKEAAVSPVPQQLDAAAAPAVAFPPLVEKIMEPGSGNSSDRGQEESVLSRNPPVRGGDPIGPVIGIATPLYQKNPLPPYPALARKRGYEGTTILRVMVNEKGMVDTVRVATSSGYGLLDKAALEAVAEWSFAPATNNGQPVAMWVMVPVRFDLP